MTGIKAIDIKDITPIFREAPRNANSWILVSEKLCDAKNLAMGVNETQAGGQIPSHAHEIEEEVMFFVEGKGEFITDDGVIDLQAGVCVYAPPGYAHAIKNTGDGVLKFIWIYSPQLPAHRKG